MAPLLSAFYSPRQPRFDTQNSHGNSQLSVTPVLRHPNSSSPSSCTVCRWCTNIHRGKMLISIFKNEKNVLEIRKIEKQNKRENILFIRNEPRRFNIYARAVVQTEQRKWTMIANTQDNFLMNHDFSYSYLYQIAFLWIQTGILSWFLTNKCD